MLAAVACTKNDLSEYGACDEPSREKCSVDFVFSRAGGQSVASRVVDELSISGIHFFIFGPENTYRYISPGENTLQIKLYRSGEYELYALANYGGTVSPNMTREQLDRLVYTGIEQNGNGHIVMSCKERLNIGDGTTAVTKPIELVRAVAKLQFTVTVAESLNAESINYQLCNVPDGGYVFGEPGTGEVIVPGGDYHTSMNQWVTGNNTIFSEPIYLPENRAGTVRGNTTGRWHGNAPQNATYLLIRVKTAVGIYDYRIYLGNNDTDDYNVSRNTSYVYNIAISGVGSSDLRVTSASMYMGWNYERSYFSSYRNFDHTIYLLHSPRVYSFSLRIECLKGDWRYLTADGVAFVDGVCDVGLISENTSSGATDYDPRIRYQPPLFTSANSLVRLRYIVTDQHGVAFSYEHDYQCANVLRAYYKWPGSTPSMVMTYSGNFWSGLSSYEGQSYYREIYIKDGGSVLVGVTPPANWQFRGWYGDQALTQLFSSTRGLNYAADVTFRTVYPKFEYPK